MTKSELVAFLKENITLELKTNQRDYYSRDETCEVALVLQVDGDSVELSSVQFEIPAACNCESCSDSRSSY